MKAASSLVRDKHAIRRNVGMDAFIVFAALLGGCHQTQPKPDQTVNDCRCACDATHPRSSVPCTGDPLDDPHAPIKSSTPL
jgi:hypothetical protein